MFDLIFFFFLNPTNYNNYRYGYYRFSTVIKSVKTEKKNFHYYYNGKVIQNVGRVFNKITKIVIHGTIDC